MEEPEKTTAQLRAELAALRQRNTHLEATMARWQRLENTVRFPTFLRELAIAQERYHDWFHFAPDGYLGPDGAGLVAFHASTLRRAVLNLVQNALDAMPSGDTVTLAGQGTATYVQLQRSWVPHQGLQGFPGCAGRGASEVAPHLTAAVGTR